MILLILFCGSTLCTLTLIYKYFQKQYLFWKELNVPHMKPSFPFGNFKEIVMMKMCTGQFVKEIYNKASEKVLGIWILWLPYLVIRDPLLIKSVLIKDFHYFTHRATIPEESDSICSRIMFFLNNPQWKNVRSKISPQFSFAKVKAMTPLFEEVSEDMKNYLRICGRKAVETKEISLKFSTDIVMSCMFGLKGNSFSENQVFYNLSKQLFGITIMNAIRFAVYFFVPEILKFFKISFVDPNITKFLRKIVWRTLLDREISNEKRNDIIDRLIQLRRSNVDVYGDGNGFDGDRLVAIPVQMFVGGVDSTANALAYALYEIGLHEDIQQKIREEVNTTLNDQEGLSYEALKDMVYLDKVLLETLRKYPILPYIDRKTVADYKLPNTDIVIKKGVSIHVSLLGLHYDPKYFPDPEVFDPERFSQENIAKRKELVYLPFGIGPRQCIGNRFALIAMKVAISQILREFRIVRCEETVPAILHPRAALLMSKHGLWMRFESIKEIS